MIFVIVAGLILAAPFLVATYLRRATKNLNYADHAWGLMEQHAHVLMEDRRLDPAVGDLVERVVLSVGDGKLTRNFLFSFVFRQRADTHGTRHLRDAIMNMNSNQAEQFSRLLITALFFDSLNAPIAGAILRRLIYWLASTANDKSAPISQYEVEPVVAAAGRMCHA